MILYGAGGHGKAIYECMRSKGLALTAVFDDHLGDNIYFKDQLVRRYDPDLLPVEKLIISIGSNSFRQKVSKIVQHQFGVVCHDSAIISKDISIGKGTMILANSAIQIDSIIREHVIVNSGAIVEHDCVIGNFTHIGPGAVVCGDVRIGEGVLIGANATVLPGVNIGDWSVIGAGSVVTNNVPDSSSIAGNPAKHI